MQLVDGQTVYSATDLVGFLACEHLANLERASVAGLVKRPMKPDPQLDRIAKRGEQCEQRFLEELGSSGLVIEEIPWIGSEPSRGNRMRAMAEQTRAAARSGVDVIYQGTFFDGSRFGRADFLRKVDAPSDLGAWSYEVWDTKLARRPTGSAVLQLCFYSDLLREIQGTLPEQMYLSLGGAEAPTVAFPTTDYAAYYRLVAREFELLVKGGEAVYPPITLPDPVEHCHVCRWSETCRNERRAADDLSLVAGITTRQRRVLRERGIGTRAGLGSLAIPVDPPLRGTSPGSVHRVREQARIQVEGTRAGRVLSERLAPTRLKDGQLEPNRGLLSLPEPSKGDLYFDIEGDPFALD